MKYLYLSLLFIAACILPGCSTQKDTAPVDSKGIAIHYNQNVEVIDGFFTGVQGRVGKYNGHTISLFVYYSPARSFWLEIEPNRVKVIPNNHQE